MVWLILLLIFVVRTSASDCLEDRLRKDLQCVDLCLLCYFLCSDWRLQCACQRLIIGWCWGWWRPTARQEAKNIVVTSFGISAECPIGNSFHSKTFSSDCPSPRPDSTTFQAWKIWTINSVTFQDLCAPWIVHFCPLHRIIQLYFIIIIPFIMHDSGELGNVLKSVREMWGLSVLVSGPLWCLHARLLIYSLTESTQWSQSLSVRPSTKFFRFEWNLIFVYCCMTVCHTTRSQVKVTRPPTLGILPSSESYLVRHLHCEPASD